MALGPLAPARRIHYGYLPSAGALVSARGRVCSRRRFDPSVQHIGVFCVTPLPIPLTMPHPAAEGKGSPTMKLQRNYSVTELMSTDAPGSVILIRLYVGLIFIVEGVLKYLRPEQLGVGRFDKVGIPAAASLANLDGAFEIGCGLLIVLGLMTRLAVLPMIVDMIGALTTTKFPLLWGSAALYPGEHGVWDFLHESRLEWAMLAGSLYLLAVGAGRRSLDARLTRASLQEAVAV